MKKITQEELEKRLLKSIDIQSFSYYEVLVCLLQIQENNYIINEKLKKKINCLCDGEYLEQAEKRQKFYEKELGYDEEYIKEFGCG